MIQNIGMRFENWSANKANYQKNINGGKVEDFQFTDKDMDTISPAEKPDYYKSQLLNISKSRIENHDRNHNGKMEFGEYVTEQEDVYYKTFGENLDMGLDRRIFYMLEKNFKNADTNGDGSIDEKEMSAVFAYMDGAKDGKLNGKIDYGSAVGTDWANDTMPKVLKALKQFIFGK